MGCSKSGDKRQYAAIQAYVKKQEKSQVYNLTLHLKDVEKGQQMKPKASRRREIIKIRAEIKDTETNKQNSSRTDQ